MPVFNGEKYLVAALEAILAQTFSDFELIISDNASSDGTQEICRAYAARDRRIRYFRNRENLGASRNHNRVFELSSGEYFKWASHDDVIGPDFLSKCLEVLDRDPSVVLCCAKTKIIDRHGSGVKSYEVRLKTDSPRPHVRFGDLMCTRHMFFPIFGLIRSSALKATPLMGDYAASDTILLARLVLMGRFHEIPEYLFFSRSHEAQSMRTLPSHLSGTIRSISRTLGVGPTLHAEWFDPAGKGRRRFPGWRIYLVNFMAGPLPPAEWFDPGQKGRILFPLWKILLELSITIRQARLSRSERARCYAHLGRWLARNCPRMARDVIFAAFRLPGSVSRALSTRGQVQREAGGGAA
jgi:glycosyltransferase involved in cell wall biosynthesis